MVFDFLPKLPKANLDDREYQDLIEECLLRIPRYCPEWTNHNPSDPGITMIEMFAWLTHQMLLRFNQLPRRNYILFLELLGIRLEPPNPATTEVTFYLVSDLPESYTIPVGIEVATERQPGLDPIVFSTDRPLTIGNPQINHFLGAEQIEETPQILRDRFTHLWNLTPTGEWSGPELPLFNAQPQPGNCFYLVFDPQESLDGNVIILTLKGQEATPTGIDPTDPPRRWEAWNGQYWQPVLLEESDDETQGFSFADIAQRGGNPLQGVDITLHLPLNFPVAQFTAYQGRWLRCVYATPRLSQPSYTRSPQIIGIGVKAIGGTTEATQCELIENDLLGNSNGEPGQRFQLRRSPILDRQEDEYLIVTPPGETAQRWQEVTDFSNSSPSDLHYLIDSLTGTLQFGPLIREPAQLKQAKDIRAILQQGQDRPPLQPPSMEHQYGAIPPRGATVQMSRYRTGGGLRGNVEDRSLNTLKSAVPYVANVVNLIPARNGTEAETIEQAAMRVPQMLRTRDRAVTPEDFESLTILGGDGAIARATCLPTNPKKPGTVQLLVVPDCNRQAIAQGVGIPPEQFRLSPPLHRKLMAYLDERRLLGVQVELLEPEYVGLSVQTEVSLDPSYRTPEAQTELLHTLNVTLYHFFNPLTGGPGGNGWPLGQPAYMSDAIALLQQVPGIRRLGAVQLFELRLSIAGQWIRSQPVHLVDPGPTGLICSWADPNLRSNHMINIIE